MDHDGYFRVTKLPKYPAVDECTVELAFEKQIPSKMCSVVRFQENDLPALDDSGVRAQGGWFEYILVLVDIEFSVEKYALNAHAHPVHEI